MYEIRCPCVKCCNTTLGTRETVRTHLKVYGIIKNYTFWYHHGEVLGEPESQCEDGDDNEVENCENEDEIREILRDFYPNHYGHTLDVHCDDSLEEEPNVEAKKFYSLLGDFEKPLYQGSKISKLSTLIKLLHIKSMGRWSNESFTMLLKMLKEELLPDEADLPNTYYGAKKVIRNLGLSYERIDACRNDCMLYWKEDNLLDSCKVCGESRWKVDKRNGEEKNKKGKKIASKILRYFPLKPRLQRLFISSKTSSLMTWHHGERVDDGIMRHPADSMAWKSFDELHPSFAAEPRNVRLGLASDGFQPFRNAKTSYSIWPVVLIPYNLPPWLCMKQENFIMSMLIPGPDSPGDAIDTYLQPLVEELKELWNIAYGNLSGWSTKGKLACPCCNKDTSSIRLTNCKKESFMGHRRYLPRNHKWRNEKKSFDGTEEKTLPPKKRSGIEILHQVQDLEGLQLTKEPKKRIKISHDSRKDNWNKKSIFFELPYWESLLLLHNLDVMHIEKNICDNILGTIMNAKGKTKDTINTRLDLKEMNIRPELHPIQKGEKYEVPTACYTLSPQEKHNFCLFLKNLKVPDGFSSNISQCVNLKDHKISGLKSHDCHVILQHLLPLALHGMLSKEVCEPLIELSLFFNMIGAKLLRIDDLEQVEAQIPITLCKLEKVFPPSFFDVMVHLPIHLANEAMLGGPVQYRWMYPIERWLYFLKSLIGNRAWPEGCIAEGYIAKECMNLCSRYLHTIDTKFNRPERNDDGGLKKSDGGLSLFCQSGKTLGAPKQCNLEANELEQAHIYILKNCDEVLPFLEEFAQIHVDSTQHLSDDEWNRQFIEWFQDKVAQLHKEDDSRIMEDLLALSCGPTKYVLHYNGYIVNGYRFHAEAYDKNLRTQNCGVAVVGETDKHSDNIDYYGVLTDVLELQFTDRRVLFECKWFDAYDKTKGVKIDEYGIVSVNWGRFLKINEPFVLADQASQVFYANDNSNRGWFDMKPSKDENQVASRVKATTKYACVPPGAIGKGRGRGLKSMLSLGVSRTDIPFSPSTDQVMQYNQFTETSVVAKGRGKGLRSMSNAQGVRTMNKTYLSVEKGHIPSFSSTDELMQYIKTNSSSAQGKYQGLKSMCSIEDSENEGRSFNQNYRYVSQNMSRPSADQGWRTMNKKFLAFEKEHMQADVPISLSTDDVMESPPTFETSFSQGLRTMNKKFLAFEKEHMQTDVAFSLSTDDAMESTPTFETSLSQGLRTTNKASLAHEKERLHSDIPISPIDQVKQSTQTAETSSCATGMDKKVRGSNKCKEVALLDIGQKLKVTFYNNRTVGKNSNLFSRHLGKIVRDRNICPLGVSSWKHIKEEKLNHMWAVVKDKFDSDDMNSHRDHVLGWMKELWNKWRGQLHEKYVKGKPIQEALKNMPKGVEKKQWEWLVKEHFTSKDLQGGKDGNPPDLATIFYETRKKNNTLVDSETIEKHKLLRNALDLKVVVMYGFGGGVKATDLKGGTSSKAELLAELRSTQKENQSLKDCVSNFQNEMKELKQLKEFFLAQHPNYQPPIQENDYSDP
ncbi:hypothetical protein MTR67_007374 [Solanum verrucosum]|uniref:Uncharacterized protein n=1 Tax=Solanum verrucosum TaxID=315347 RepID=A0AAF0TD22_SOLVR|nr:hypothetical protein MTR67_001133 [Solanum verrucosum]WMV13989.1 hypothetical protein MTR67_007374 [Solanum verrucosum]